VKAERELVVAHAERPLCHSGVRLELDQGPLCPLPRTVAVAGAERTVGNGDLLEPGQRDAAVVGPAGDERVELAGVVVREKLGDLLALALFVRSRFARSLSSSGRSRSGSVKGSSSR
jgi:hypothetical protein